MKTSRKNRITKVLADIIEREPHSAQANVAKSRLHETESGMDLQPEFEDHDNVRVLITSKKFMTSFKEFDIQPEKWRQLLEAVNIMKTAPIKNNGRWVWKNRGIEISTTTDPISGKKSNPYVGPGITVGWATEISIIGQLEKVQKAHDLITQLATNVKIRMKIKDAAMFL